jgi:asparagine synthase (glutamine-hydrolysing)
MCGIAFSYRPDVPPDELSRSMEHACKLMAHRGPDLAGQRVHPPWSMGHRRLSIIDLQSSAQPIVDPAGRFFLSYNGEIYNYLDLRERLKDCWEFTTAGDAEVVLAGLCRYGIEFLTLMEGMWALALWDQREQVLLLVRDRMGKKPLYYCSDEKAFACASELRALNALSEENWREDGHSTADYFRYGFFLPGTTHYRHIYEVLPAHWLKWSPGKPLVTEPYWRLSPSGFTGTRANAGMMLKEALFNSVRMRMVADVDVGALLSGGVDSSLVVCAMNRMCEKPVETFTIGFGDAAYDERSYARALAAHCRTDHREQLMAWDHCEELSDRVLTQMAQPFGDASLLPAALVSRMASRHLKVVLSGDGGDELFGGYNRYLARSCLRWLTRLPRQVKERIHSGVKSLSGLGLRDDVVRFIVRIADMVRRMEDETPYVAPLTYDQWGLRQLLPDHWRKGHRPPGMPKETQLDDIRRMMVADALIYLPQDILSKMDRAGMAFSLEVRSPFLDRRVVELAYSLPRHWHRRGIAGKRMLRTAFEGVVPDWIWKRPKRGFAVPLDKWFRNGLQHRLLELLSFTHHPLNKAFVEKMVGLHLSGRFHHGIRLWQIYAYLHWSAFRSFPYGDIGPRGGVNTHMKG